MQKMSSHLIKSSFWISLWKCYKISVRMNLLSNVRENGEFGGKQCIWREPEFHWPILAASARNDESDLNLKRNLFRLWLKSSLLARLSQWFSYQIYLFNRKKCINSIPKLFESLIIAMCECFVVSCMLVQCGFSTNDKLYLMPFYTSLVQFELH